MKKQVTAQRRTLLYRFIAEAHTRGYALYESSAHPYNLNIVGWRERIPSSTQFTDRLGVYWKDDGTWVSREWDVTTVPGKPWLLKPMNPKGAAVLVPGQYRQAYALGDFRGYTALKQVAPVKVYRDYNQDSHIDMSSATIEEGYFGIHIHRAGVWSKIVGTSSAGCQVFARHKDFAEFITICQLGAAHWGNSFTYTLLEL